MNYYIASCVFTERFPALSVRIQNFMSERYNLKVVRCYTPNYKVTEFEERIPDAQSAITALKACSSEGKTANIWLSFCSERIRISGRITSRFCLVFR